MYILFITLNYIFYVMISYLKIHLGNPKQVLSIVNLFDVH